MGLLRKKIKRNIANKNYDCFICNGNIAKGTTYYSYNICSSTIIESFERITGWNYCHNIYEVYLKLNMCSEKCINEFFEWKNTIKKKRLRPDLDIKLNMIEKLKIKERKQKWCEWKEKYINKIKAYGGWCDKCQTVCMVDSQSGRYSCPDCGTFYGKVFNYE